MKSIFTQNSGGGQYLAPEVILIQIGTEAGFAISSQEGANEGYDQDAEQNPW